MFDRNSPPLGMALGRSDQAMARRQASQASAVASRGEVVLAALVMAFSNPDVDGMHLTEGDVLAIVADLTRLRLALATARTRLAEAEAQLDKIREVLE
jgi:hypothetical protein